MQTITACIIVKNELSTLSACLRSLDGYVDEIVIADTGSTDGTQYLIQAWMEVAKTPIKFTEFTYEGDFSFSDARNYAMDLATGDWIFTVDADDRIDVSDYADLRKILGRDEFELGNFDVLVANVYNLYGNAEIRDAFDQPRLFRRSKGPRYFGAVHNQISFPGQGDVNMLKIKMRIYHIGYGMLSTERLKEKHDRVVLMCERQVGKSPTQAYAWYNLGNAVRTKLMHADKADQPNIALEVINCCDKALNFVTDEQPHIAAMSAKLKSWMLYYLQRYDEALDAADLALTKQPKYLDAILVKGYIFADKRDFPNAMYWLKQYIRESERFQNEETFENVTTERANERSSVYKTMSAIEAATLQQQAANLNV